MTRATSETQIVARALVLAFHGALRSIRLYPRENVVVRNALNELTDASLRVVSALGQCEVRCAGDYIFVNGAQLRLQLDTYASIAHVTGRMRAAGVGGILIVERPDFGAWFELIAALLQPHFDVTNAERLSRITMRLSAAHIVHFQLEPAGDEDLEVSDEGDQERAQQTFVRSLNATRELMASVRLGKSPALKRVKRAVQGIVDSIMTDPASLVGLTNLREFDDYTFVHSVNVCILAVSLGRRIGLDKLQLLDLGLAALMHDIGKSRVPLDVLNKRGALDADEFRILQLHTTRGLLALSGMAGTASRAWRSMTVAYEHHMRTDLSGYPATVRPRSLSLFSKIVSIVDGFDAATSTRVYQPQPWSPSDVLRGMRDDPRFGLDPILVKAFINLTGIYPAGTVVLLDTQEMGVVLAASTDPAALSRPRVRLLFDERGNGLADAPVVDLTERDDAGNFRRTVIRSENPDRYGITVSDYFL